MTCTKARYKSERRARAASRRLSNSTELTFRPYACPDCGYWHLTTQEHMRPRLPKGFTKGLRGRVLRPGERLEDVAREMRGTGDE